MSFWGGEVLPKTPYIVSVPAPLTLASATLASDAAPGKRCILYCKHVENGVTYALASLRAGKEERADLSVSFEQGALLEFSVEGTASIHLQGYLGQREEPDNESYGDEDDEDGSEFDDEEDEDDEKFGSGDDEDSEDDEEDESEEEEAKPLAGKRVVPEKKQQSDAKKAKAEPKAAAQKPAAQDKKKPEAATPPQKAPEQKKPAPQQFEVQKFPNGLEIKEVELGSGKEAQNGKRITVKYFGTLQNGKKFDSNNNFVFRLGTGEVIKGWDLGFKGMKVGGKRRLKIPPSLGYGKQKTGPIPANSTLFFDVELKGVQ